MLTVGHETLADAQPIEDLLDQAFGPDRYRKTCQRLRDGQSPAKGMAFVAHEDAEDGSRRLVGTLRFWDIRIGYAHRALLLGPLAVRPDCQSGGIGSKLMWLGLSQAEARGHHAVILVGDEPYYRRFGFVQHLTRRMMLPGPVDRSRFLALELEAGALREARGMISPWLLPAGRALAA